MSVATKLQTIAENEQRVYEAGKQKGYTEGEAKGREEGIAEGKQAEWSEFWDSYQENGNRTDYQRAFSGSGWTAQTFRPKYDIILTANNGTHMFRNGNTTVKMDMSAMKNELGINIDFSQCTDLQYVFAGSMFSVIDLVDGSNATSFNNTFYGGYGNCLQRIDRVIITEKCSNFRDCFERNYNLTYIGFEGVIAANGLALRYCPALEKETFIKLFECLQDKTTDTSGTEWKVTLGSTNLAKLTEEELSIAYNKGWSVE